MKMRPFTVFGFLASMALLVLVVLALTTASPGGLANAAPPAADIAGARSVESVGHIGGPTRAASTEDDYAVDLSPVTKAYMDCTSIYTVTNQSVISSAFTVHEFFEAGTSTAVFSLTDTIAPIASTAYDLVDISGLPDGFTGTLTINSNCPITATLEPCPSRTYYVYLPLVARNWEYLPEPVIPNDTRYSTYQWNLPQIRAPYAWAVSTGSSDVIVAVLDSGVDLTHPDLEGQLVAGYDFVNTDTNPSDDRGHGTHVAGIVAAHTNNNQGMASVAWGSKIMPVKVLDSRGRGTHSQGADGIIWATGQGARIINLSLGGESSSATLQNAVNYAYDRGVLVVAAAGNKYEQGNPVMYPAAYPHVLAVAATGDQDEHADYSETGAYVDVAAPGGNPSSSWDSNPDHWILSTYWRGAGRGEYLQVSGTSQAAPHVAGLAALVWSVNPSMSNDQVEQVIEETAVDLGAPGRDDVFGYGRIDAYKALVRAPYGASAGGLETSVSSLPSADTFSSPTHRVPPGGTGRTGDEFETGVILVKFKTEASEEGISSTLGKFSAQITGQIPALGVLRLSVPEGREIELSEQLSQDPAVEYAEPDYVVHAF
jgi:type VII secretion-associated serine protease mycosin